MDKKIKVLFFIETLKSGGAEKVLCNLVNNMDYDAFDITVHTLWRCNKELYLHPNIHYRYVFSSENRISECIARIIIETKVIYPLFIRDDYDIEIAYLESGPTKIIASSTNEHSIKLAWVHCDLINGRAHSPDFIKKSTKWYSKFHKVVCVSQEVLNSFRELFGDTTDSCMLYNTINDEEIRAKSMYDLPTGVKKRRFTIAFVGRLSPPKNLLRLLRVHHRLMVEGYEYDLWLVGEGEDRSKIETFVKQNGIEGSVFLYGYQSNPYPFMENADILVCSSDYEGFSTYVTEGLIIGKPIVSTDVSGMRELLGDSEYGFVTKRNDDDFYEGVKLLLENKVIREKYLMKAQERGQRFKKDVLVNDTESFLKETMRGIYG